MGPGVAEIHQDDTSTPEHEILHRQQIVHRVVFVTATDMWWVEMFYKPLQALACSANAPSEALAVAYLRRANPVVLWGTLC